LVAAVHKEQYCNKQYEDLSRVVYQEPQEPYSLVICEKPAAALRIAHALGTASLRRISRLEAQCHKKEGKDFKRQCYMQQT
jgi:hypothetical protein